MLVPKVTSEGQAFVDLYAPKDKAGVVYEIKPNAVAELFGAKPVEVTVDRVSLRWMKPGPNGRLVPRESERGKPSQRRAAYGDLTFLGGKASHIALTCPLYLHVK